MPALSVPHALSSSPMVRRSLREELLACGTPRDVVEDTALLVAELVGNALRHADPLPDGTISVSWDVGPSALVVSVTDGGATTSPGLRPMHAFETSGRGLPIVEALAVEWGVRRRGGSTTVWATMPLAHLPAEPEPPVRAGAGRRAVNGARVSTVS
ncbi:MAG: ATP-binding protein [Frankiaceae bacterium]